jgi:hypothetical protein
VQPPSPSPSPSQSVSLHRRIRKNIRERAASGADSRGLEFRRAARFHREDESNERGNQWTAQKRQILSFAHNLATLD